MAPLFDWSEPEGQGEFHTGPKYKAGDIVRVRVADCESRTSKKGDDYFNVTLQDDTGWTVTYDVIMCAGPGRKMGQVKMRILGFTEEDTMILDAQLVGRRCWIKLDEDEYQGKKKLVTAFHWTEHGWRAGYHRDGPPPGEEGLEKEEAQGGAPKPAAKGKFVEHSVPADYDPYAVADDDGGPTPF